VYGRGAGLHSPLISEPAASRDAVSQILDWIAISLALSTKIPYLQGLV